MHQRDSISTLSKRNQIRSNTHTQGFVNNALIGIQNQGFEDFFVGSESIAERVIPKEIKS
jgi:hypothetical protein